MPDSNLPKFLDLVSPLIESFFGEAASGGGESNLKDPPPTSEQMNDLLKENQRLQGELSKAPLAERKAIVVYLRGWARMANKVGRHDLASELASLMRAIEDGDHVAVQPLNVPPGFLRDTDWNRTSSVPSNDDLAEKAKNLDAQTVVRGWLQRHAQSLSPGSGRDAWLDWAAANFLADPEVRAHLRPAALEDIEETEWSVERERVVEFLRERAEISTYWNIRAFFNQTAGDIEACKHWAGVEPEK